MVTGRKLIVEVVDARNLMSKDGHGASSPFVVVKCGSQSRRTETKVRDLNPVWNETLSFDLGTPSGIHGNVLKVKVKHDMNHGPIRRSSTLGRIRLDSTSFAEKGQEVLIYYPLKRGILKNVKGEIGLKVYYVNEEILPPQESVTEPPVEPEIVEEPPVEPEIVEEPPKRGDMPECHGMPEKEKAEFPSPPEAEKSVEPEPESEPSPEPEPKSEPEPEAVPQPPTEDRTDQGNLAPPGTSISISSYIFEFWKRLSGSSISIFSYVFDLLKRLPSSGVRSEARLV